jgi:hypothetical protein
MGNNEIMSEAVEITGAQLTNALRALDVNFIMGGQGTNETLHKQPARLIAALAESDEARLRLLTQMSVLQWAQLEQMLPLKRHISPSCVRIGIWCRRCYVSLNAPCGSSK